ncbi:GDP-mannose 4,6-dehydratase [Actinomadura viridis]|uniref:UDP-glucose 4-epimerase n=1 Tax=Actinomadura viridis TaxID=58110 RepID=A0A931DLK1_9ACTN|nr:NAD-dependent epimerase/dehydratase family protein [Actinomadura viridis]MBG6092230.1 UDP-glucose 4-epimerase [Actinomadura viridis]
MSSGTRTSYLVTGGAGFIGSHLADAMLARGDTVTVLDNLSTGDPARLEGARAYPGLRFVHGSVLDELMVDELVHQCDVVVHMAAAVGVKLVVEQPLRSLTTNIRGSEIVIEAAHRYRRKILLTSTSEIYGKNSAGPLRESADRIIGSPAIVRWSYSTAKAVDEILANCYHRERGLETIVVRLFNTVGPRQSPAYGMVIPRLVRQALRGEPLTVFGDGCQTRCFAHVADVVDAILRLLDEDAAIGQTFNIGSSQEISIRELAETIIARCGSRSPIQLVPYEQAYGAGFEDMLRRVPETSRLRALTGWAPRYCLDDVLAAAIEEARDELAEPAGLAGLDAPAGHAAAPVTV